MPNGTYGGVRGRKTKVGRKLLRFPPTRLEAVFPSFILLFRFCPSVGICSLYIVLFTLFVLFKFAK